MKKYHLNEDDDLDPYYDRTPVSEIEYKLLWLVIIIFGGLMLIGIIIQKACL